MDRFILEHEAGIRPGFFFGIFAVMAAWELLAPRRDAPHCVNLKGLLLMPFTGKVTDYAINRHKWGRDD